MIKILEGLTLSKELSEKLKKQIANLEPAPCLAIFQIGDNKESDLYIRKKKEFGEKVGAEVRHFKFPENVSQEDLEREVEKAGADRNVHGIIIQLPLPQNLDPNRLIEKINPLKDVDGLTSFNTRKLLANDSTVIIPATARGVLNLLEYYRIDVEGKNAVVIGRSALVGKPVALSLLNRNATVTICHRKTRDLKRITRTADIIVTAMGQPEFIDGEYVSSGQIVIDIGINTVSGTKMEEEVEVKRKVVGDVHFESVKEIVSAMTPVPGGIGPLTVASLFENLLDSYKKLRK